MPRGRGPRSPANASTPRRRPARSGPAGKGSGPRRVRPLRGKPTPSDAAFEDKYPNLAAQREQDRLLHIKAARSMGATREQASRHAAAESGDH